MSESASIEAPLPTPPAPAPHDAAPAEGQGGHHYSFTTVLASHQLPGPAWEYPHGNPLLIFDLGRYAVANADGLLAEAKAQHLQADPCLREWASSIAPASGRSADDLALAMTAADAKAPAMPRALSWFNQQTFFGTLDLVFITVVVGVLLRRRSHQLKPAGRLQHLVEAAVSLVRDDLVKPNFHHAVNGWTLHFSSLFLALLTFNMIGLIPGASTASGNPAINAGFAVMTLLCMLGFGMKEQGLFGFWKNLVPVHWTWKPMDMAIFCLLAVIEFLGLLIKPTALTIRLFANMFSGHTVILTFVSLFFILFFAGQHWLFSLGLGAFGFVVAVAMYFLELLVAFLQAYVFTFLSALFIGASIHPEH